MSEKLMAAYRLDGKTALICGASAGIGRAAALLLAERGARIIALARDQNKLQQLLSELAHPEKNHQIFSIDLSDIEKLKTEILPIISKMNIQILINNAGGPKGGSLLEANVTEMLNPLQGHLFAAHLLVQTVAPAMKQTNFGRIISIISTSVKVPLPGLGISNTVRGAVANWSKTLANELAPFGITVNNILPGYIRTDRFNSLLDATTQNSELSRSQVEEQWKKQIPMSRIGEPSEIAEAIAFLASPASSYITGINLPVDGGRTPSL